MSGKIDYLESLRGVAAFVVVLAHFAIGFYPALWWAMPEQVRTESGLELFLSGTPLNLLYNGSFSVSIFFVLSGFVLTHRFFRDPDARIALLPAFAKRYTRLLFPILFSSALAYLLLRLSWFSTSELSGITGSSWLKQFWTFEPNLPRLFQESFVGAYFTGLLSYNNVLWTMRWEFYGSLIVFTCVVLFGRHRRRDWYYVLAALIFRRSFYLAFILGMVLADFSTRDKNIFLRVRHKGYYVALLLMGLVLGSYPVDRPVAGTLYEGLEGFAGVRTYQIIGATLVMIALLNSRRLQDFFSKSPLVFLGRISFSLYVLHFMIMGSLSSALFVRLSAWLSYHAAFFLTAALSVPVMIILAHFMQRSIDERGVRASQLVYRTAGRWLRSWTSSVLGRLPSRMAEAMVVRRVLGALCDSDAPLRGRDSSPASAA